MSEASTRTVERALALLAAVCEHGNVNLADVARAVDLSPSTALRLLRTLEQANFVRRDDAGEYRAGVRIVQLGTQALGRESLIDLSHSEMVALGEATDESVYLSVEGHRDTALYISIVEGTQSVRHTNWVGRTIPLAGSAAGAVLRGETPASGVVVVELGIERDVTALAAPILAGGRVLAALSILVPSYRMTSERQAHHSRLLADAAHRISAQLDATHAPREAHS